MSFLDAYTVARTLQDPVASALQLFYGAQRMAEDRKAREEQLASQKLYLRLRQMEEERRAKADEQEALRQQEAVAAMRRQNLLGSIRETVSGVKDPQRAREISANLASLYGLPPEPISEPLLRTWAEKGVKPPAAPHVITYEQQGEKITQEWDPATGGWRELGRSPARAEPRPPVPHYQVIQAADAQGNPVFARVNTLTGEVQPLGGSVSPPKKASPSATLSPSQRSSLVRQTMEMLKDPLGGGYLHPDTGESLSASQALDLSKKLVDAMVEEQAKAPQPFEPTSPQLMPAHPPQRPLDRETAAKILQEAGGDKNKARELARARGYVF